MIPIFSNTLQEEELRAVWSVMQSRWIGFGPECQAFEKELAAHFGVDQIHLTNCATSAIYLALRAFNLKSGDQVIIPANHFVATAGAVLEMGGIPVFADIDSYTLNLDPQEIGRLRTERTVGVILNHYGGHPCPMDRILEQSDGLWILEDAANGPASTYKKKALGTLGDAGIWSFDSMKILSMGDGGALWFRDPNQRERINRLRNMGLSALSGTDSANRGSGRWWEFEVKEPSPRFDSNDLLACIGRVQLSKLKNMVARRRQIWDFYQKELYQCGDLLVPPEPLTRCTSSYYLYWIQTLNRDALARHLYDSGIYTTFRYYPLHRAFGYDKWARISLPASEEASETTLCLPIHQNLTNDQAAMIVEKIWEYFDG